MKVIYLEKKRTRQERSTMEGRSESITNKKDAIIQAQELYLSVFRKYPTLDENRVATNLDRVLDYLNIMAESVDLNEVFDECDDVAGLLLKEDNEWYIYTNSTNPAYRQRFTIAHEIGHYYLNHIPKETSNDVIWRDNVSTWGTDTKEISANAFAAELLMPSKIIAEMYEWGYSPHKMAYELRVSVAAINYRLDSLGY